MWTKHWRDLKHQPALATAMFYSSWVVWIKLTVRVQLSVLTSRYDIIRFFWSWFSSISPSLSRQSNIKALLFSDEWQLTWKGLLLFLPLKILTFIFNFTPSCNSRQMLFTSNCSKLVNKRFSSSLGFCLVVHENLSVKLTHTNTEHKNIPLRETLRACSYSRKLMR